jgi:hypothetical protein
MLWTIQDNNSHRNKYVFAETTAKTEQCCSLIFRLLELLVKKVQKGELALIAMA